MIRNDIWITQRLVILPQQKLNFVNKNLDICISLEFKWWIQHWSFSKHAPLGHLLLVPLFTQASM